MYVEVIYLEKIKKYKGRKLQEYPSAEIESAFMRTVGKLTTNKVQALVCMRTDEHQLIKSLFV